MKIQPNGSAFVVIDDTGEEVCEGPLHWCEDYLDYQDSLPDPPCSLGRASKDRKQGGFSIFWKD